MENQVGQSSCRFLDGGVQAHVYIGGFGYGFLASNRGECRYVDRPTKRAERLYQDGYAAGLACAPGRQPREEVGDGDVWARGYAAGKNVRLAGLRAQRAARAL